jgi:hypothetical protein
MPMPLHDHTDTTGEFGSWHALHAKSEQQRALTPKQTAPRFDNTNKNSAQHAARQTNKIQDSE